MGLRCLCVFAFLISLSPSAFAAEHASCSTVRYYVAKFGATVAEQWARSTGISEAQINAARRCLKPAPTRTAQAGQD